MLSFALVNCGPSSAWIGAYFLGRIKKKKKIHHKLLRSLKSLGLFSVLKNVSTDVHSNFLLFRSEESGHHLRTHIFHVEIVTQNLSNSFLVNVN